MKALSTEAKKAYFAQTRRSNFAASLRLEGYQTQPEDASQTLTSREEILRRYGKVKP
ncbi:YhfG family protein [Marinospirillum sp.]|uniref:YhfG family protein n=1 Tax=Marinospirillum sp. TaxID=2183934 RepID=UPI00384E8981